MAVTLKQAQAVHSVYIQRKTEYAKRSDKCMVEFQLGRITKEDWEAKRQEVKDLLPYPEGVDKQEALQLVADDTGWEIT